MKRIAKLLLGFVVFTGLIACSHSSPFNTVKYVVKCSFPDEKVRIYDPYDRKNVPYPQFFKGTWEHTNIVKTSSYSIEVLCDNQEAQIEVDFYVNGKLKKHFSDNSYVRAGIDIK